MAYVAELQRLDSTYARMRNSAMTSYITHPSRRRSPQRNQLSGSRRRNAIQPPQRPISAARKPNGFTGWGDVRSFAT
jgi:hypothetical protein